MIFKSKWKQSKIWTTEFTIKTNVGASVQAVSFKILLILDFKAVSGNRCAAILWGATKSFENVFLMNLHPRGGAMVKKIVLGCRVRKSLPNTVLKPKSNICLTEKLSMVNNSSSKNSTCKGEAYYNIITVCKSVFAKVSLCIEFNNFKHELIAISRRETLHYELNVAVEIKMSAQPNFNFIEELWQ